MKCPCCKEELWFHENTPADTYMDRYGQACVARTKCCGRLVSCAPRTVISTWVYKGSRTEDDWGN